MPRALLSVFDKTGLIDLARALVRSGYELVASGGTATALTTAGLACLPVESLTGFPEMLDGRVKTLHPALHAAILADRSNAEHVAQMAAHHLTPIDIVVCNLYPFHTAPGIELIDVGGPTMVRGAAKNHAHVTVLVDPADYPVVIEELRVSGGHVGLATRQRLAATAFGHLAAYDAAIAHWMTSLTDEAVTRPAPEGESVRVKPAPPEARTSLPDRLVLPLERAQSLRYGENPHQLGARYRVAHTRSWWDDAVQHGGKELSYLNVYDADAAWRLVHDLGDDPAAVIIKHANPCGAALGPDIVTAYRLAHEGDPVAAFGGVVAVNRTVSEALAEAIAPVFTEVLVAPAFTPEALAVLRERKNLRLLAGPAPERDRLHIRSIAGGLLVQETDEAFEDDPIDGSWRVGGSVTPTEEQWRQLRFAWRVCAHVSSNAIVIASGAQAVGIGAGQQSRVDAAQLAVTKAGDRAKRGVAASDAFFPFRDGLDLLASAGVAAVVEPGGSVRDDEVIAAADTHGIAIVLTGRRHFRH